MSEHPQFAEDIDLLALDMLGDEDCATVRAHLEECANCRTRFDEARSLAALLAFSAPPAAPPGRVRRKLLAELRTRQAEGLRAQPEPRAAASGWNWSNLGWAVAVLVILAVTAMLSEQYRRAENELSSLRAEIATKQVELDHARSLLDLLHSSDTVRVKLMSGTAPWPWPEGKVYYHPKKGLLFVASNLPPVESGKVYQLWYVPAEGAPLSAGVFAPDVHGNATLMTPPSAKAMAPKAFAVTVERAGGVPAPTGPEVLSGEY
ncbi:MAG TPA: anti-sigma factor [Candidatus Acidoferrales bacterium]|nr:anti-sigma factor [Candidatus Acidoferrales bacterium]